VWVLGCGAVGLWENLFLYGGKAYAFTLLLPYSLTPLKPKA
jgi:hypothetical protein